ncbi:MAG: hypothetical protein N3B13_11905, partial [Deltaproteobacteria bacterium]|nr:hypothetical protein [Deltaproteobacteria bacterium]
YDTPQPTDSVLMDTFRVVDEWPSINNVISAVNMKFELNTQSEDFDKVAHQNEFGESERKIYTLLIENPDYDVQKLIDISRLGEFETCKALYNLVRTGIMVAKKPKNAIPFNALKGGPLSTRRIVIPSVLILNIFLGVVAFLTVIVLISGIISRIKTVREESPNAAVRVSVYKHLISDITKERIRNSANVYRYSFGTFPGQAEQIVKTGLLDERDLSYPFRQKYIYKVQKDEILIDTPLF